MKKHRSVASPRNRHRRGVTLVEVAVATACGGVAVAMAPVVLQSKADGAKLSMSVANLRNLGSANESYAGDWNDRQYTGVPDDAGTAKGDCAGYLDKVGCPPQVLLGWDTDGAMWGYFIGSGGKCAKFGYPGNCGNWPMHLPMAPSGESQGYGGFRLPGAKAFHDYVNGRYYDSVFYAPKDAAANRDAAKFLTDPSEFASNGKAPVESSYCWSPAAMFAPKVFARNGAGLDGNGFTDPATLADGFRSPPVSRCKYPSLKTRMIEHNWLQDAPDEKANPAFAGGATPWFFNHGAKSAPASLFFDGHIELVACERARAAEARGLKLWSRNTPFGADGYFGQAAFDTAAATSFHVLTTDGIEGRDVLGAEEGGSPAPAKPERRKAPEKPLQAPGSAVKVFGVKAK